MDERCYVCHRMLEESKEFIDGFIRNNLVFFMNDPEVSTKPTGEERFAAASEEYNMAKYGMYARYSYRFSVRGNRQTLPMAVPLCPVCEGIWRQLEDEMISYVDDIVDDLRNGN